MRHTTRTDILVPGSLAIIWLTAALWRPNSTFHLAPLFIMIAAQLDGQTVRRPRWRTIVNGASIATGAALVISALGLMRGPSFLPLGGALAEALVLVVVTAIAVAGGSQLGPIARKP